MTGQQGATPGVVPWVTDAISDFPLRKEALPTRLCAALAASASLHLCVAGALLSEVPQRPGAEQATPAISARLAVAEAAVEPPVSMLQSPKKGPAPRLYGLGKAAASSPRPPPELAYYSATELDVFPRLLAPLELHRLEKAVEETGRIRTMVKIDELGVVKDVEIAGADWRVREGLRAMLAAARFAPALKDGHPVRSRVVLDLNLAGY